MLKSIFLYFCFLAACTGQDIPNDKTRPNMTFLENNNTTATYHEAIYYFEKFVDHPKVQVSTVGKTDSGYPLHEIVITNDGVYDPADIRRNGKVILMINNGIHPGEPCGIDASMILTEKLLSDKSGLLEHATIILVPVYNIGGCLNRGSHSRANQVGPEAYGFRGNAQNLDLNRDFVKSDSENAKTFTAIYQKWLPQVFIDNHTSNGADYQYVMTLIATQKDKLHPSLSRHMSESMLPYLYESMKNEGYEMTPYVYSMKDTPDGGIMAFLDLGRYSSGYAAMHHTISFMPETHMLKPYKDRVMSTLLFMESMLEHIDKHHAAIIHNQKEAREQSAIQKEWTLHYELDRETVDTVSFKGYEAKYRPSEITGKQRLYYDRSLPYEKQIPYYNTYKSKLQIEKPDAYIVPQAYSDIVSKLIANGIRVETLEVDQDMEVEVYYIENYKTVDSPFEGHYLHYDVEVSTRKQTMQYRKGDYKISADQAANRYLVECLEPQGPDSYFAWNYFDGILMQKEYFSPYVWEDLAAEILESDSDLQQRFEDKKASDSEFTEDASAQLFYIYKHSVYYEPTYRRYPVGRVLK